MTSLLSQIGNSLFDQAGSEKVASLVEKANKNNVKLVFPVDYITGDKFAKDANVGEATDAQGIPDGCMGLDVGPLSRDIFRSTVLEAKTILWNGQVIHQLPIDALTTFFLVLLESLSLPRSQMVLSPSLKPLLMLLAMALLLSLVAVILLLLSLNKVLKINSTMSAPVVALVLNFSKAR